jgi:hypothetical protein
MITPPNSIATQNQGLSAMGVPSAIRAGDVEGIYLPARRVRLRQVNSALASSITSRGICPVADFAR